MPTPKLLITVAYLVLVSGLTATVTHAQSGSSLDLSLDTGATATVPDSRPTGRAAVGSRGLPTRISTPRQVVLGKLAVVTASQAPIRRGRTSSATLLSNAASGTYLAVISDVGAHYGVLMIDKSTGWVSKTDVKMIDYQVFVGDPNAAIPPAASPTPPPVASRSGSTPNLPDNLDARQVALLREAFSYLGVRYVWAGNTRAGLDCSAFVKNVFATQGVSLPRHSGDQARVGTPVAWQDLRAGDRLYFDMKHVGRVSHCGIYLGNGYFIHASTNQGKVGVDSILKPGYYRALVGARRM